MSVVVFDAQRSIHMLCCYVYSLFLIITREEKKSRGSNKPKAKGAVVSMEEQGNNEEL